MILHPPLIITARLMPGLRIGNGTISLGYSRRSSDNRMVYQVWIDIPDGEHETTDLRSGCGGGGIQDGLANLLGFLGAAAELRQYRERNETRSHAGDCAQRFISAAECTCFKSEIDPDSNESLFPPTVVDWASENSDEISMLACELEETPNLVEE